MITIENDYLSVKISSQGATLQSIFGKQVGIEYLWQGDPTYWKARSPNLFPFVGRLYEGRYVLNNQSYPMKCHGFLSKQILSPKLLAKDHCIFSLSDNTETFSVYPYHFDASMEYSLCKNRIEIAFRVENRSEDPMYCGFGGHPGFNVPLEDELSFEDYSMVFPERCAPKVVTFSQGVLTTGQVLYSLDEERILHLKHSLFSHDAVVLTDVPRQVTLASEKGSHGVTVSFPQMPYIGFWHKPCTDAPFICVEPWSVLPGREGVVEDITTMPGLTFIQSGDAWENIWSIEIF